MFFGGVYLRNAASNDASGRPPCPCGSFALIRRSCASTVAGANRQSAANSIAGPIEADRATMGLRTYIKGRVSVASPVLISAVIGPIVSCQAEGEPIVSHITLKVNGAAHTVDIEPATPLLYILRNDLGLQGPRFGCGLGQCGACTVIINGVATRSCITPTSAVKGEITTLEGIASDGKLHPLQQAW